MSKKRRGSRFNVTCDESNQIISMWKGVKRGRTLRTVDRRTDRQAGRQTGRQAGSQAGR